MRLSVLITISSCVIWPFSVLAQDDAVELTAGFIRFHKTARAEAQLQTSVCNYRHPQTGRVVALVSAVHVGDPQYYRDLQAHLDAYDMVLFERVGSPDEERDEAAAARLSIIGELQLQLGELLELTHQMQGIDYERANLRHADMSFAAFTAALEERGDPLILAAGLMRFLAPFLRMSFAMQKAMKEVDPQMTNRMRWQMGSMLGDLDRLLARLGIDKNENPDDVIIGVRNEYAWSILEKTLPEGHQRIAIFYGGAHMPDFQRRLLEGGWQLESCEWIGAWYIPTPEAEQDSGKSPPTRDLEAAL